jgi:hypothetical protein
MRKCLCLFIGAALAANWSQAATLTVAPSTVSNTYAGTITLQVGGLTNGETVVVQKYLDANANGVIDAGDLLWQQFSLTDGQATVFHDGATAVTNLAVPGDLDSTSGQITAELNLPVSGFEQSIVANYLFKVSSPTGNFTPLTNSFTVTNFPFGQSFGGSVVANGTNVPGAAVLLFQPSGNNMSPKSGAAVDNSGNYSISAPAGTYLLVAFKSSYVANVGSAPTLALASGANINTNLSLLSADRSLSGSLIDASNAVVGLPGVLLPISSKNGLLMITVTDSNGTFTASVTSDNWKIEGSDGPIAFHGYLRPQNKTSVDTTTGSVANVSIALPKANAIFYGSVKDNLNQPMSGISMNSSDNSGSYSQNVPSDLNGNYFAGALSGEPWQVGISNDGNPTNYVFSQTSLNGGTNLNVGQALHINFNALPATQSITGHVQQSSGQPISSVQVFASASIGDSSYAVQVDTDSSGNYSLNVANPGNWFVSVSCQGGNDSLDAILGSGTYICPNNQTVTISNNNGAANFTIYPCGSIQIANISPLPIGTVGSYYSLQFQATSCSGNFNWSTNSGTVPPGLTLYSGGAFNGTPTTTGTFNFTVHVSDGGGASTNQNFSITINPRPTISAPARSSNSQFQMSVNGSSGQNYTVQMSTDLATTNWTPLLVTNPPAGSFLFKDVNATNAARFYRVLIGP